MEEEEENIYTLARDEFNKSPEGYVLGGAAGTAAGATQFNPSLIGSAAEQRMINQGRASIRNPAYRNLLGKARGTIAKNLVKAGGIPATAAFVAADTVSQVADQTEQNIENLYSDAGSDMEKAGADLAERLRKLNLIEEQKAFDEGRPAFGGEEGITMGNLDEYFASNPDFSGIGDFTLPGDEPMVSPMVQQTQVEPTMGGIDYSSAFAGNQPTAPMSESGRMTGFRPQFEGQTLGQYLRYEDTPEQATMQRLDPQGRLRQFTSDGQLAPQYSAYEAESQRVQDKLKNQPKRVGSASEVGTGDTAQGDLSLSDYRSILREQGIGGSAQIAKAKQMMTEAEAKKRTAELNAERIRAYTAKSMQPKEPRAPTSAELTMGVVNQMSNLQNKINQGIQLSDEEQMLYDSGNAFLQIQSRDSYFDSPFQMPNQDVADATALPSATTEDLLDRNGNRRRVPMDQVEEALKAGYTRL
jgi:hypothetical protein